MAAISKPVGYSSGQFFATSNVSNPTAVRLRAVQDQSVDWKAKVDELMGAERFALATATGAISVTGKVNFGMSNVRAWSDLLSGDSQAVGQTKLYQDEVGTLVSHAYTVTNASGTSKDRGVVNKTNNVPYARVAAGSEVAGSSYSFVEATGVYTFNTSETGTVFYFTYLNTPLTPGTNTSTVVLANTLQGPTTNFQVDQVFPYGTDQDILSLFNCAAEDMSMSAKQGFGSSSLGFRAAVNDNGQIGQFSFAHAA